MKGSRQGGSDRETVGSVVTAVRVERRRKTSLGPRGFRFLFGSGVGDGWAANVVGGLVVLMILSCISTVSAAQLRQNSEPDQPQAKKKQIPVEELPRSNRTGIESLHAWGIDVAPDGSIYVADATDTPLDLIWRIPGEAFDELPDGASVEGWTLEEDVEPKVVIHGQGIRDLHFTKDGTLYYSVGTFGYTTPDGSEFTGDDNGADDNAGQAVDLPAGTEVTVVAHGLKRRLPNGEFETVIEDTRDPRIFSGAPFRVDEEGRIYSYWLGHLFQRDTDGTVRTLLGSSFRGARDGGFEEARFNSVRAMTWAPDGDLYLVDIANIRRIDMDEPAVSTVASRLIVRDGDRPPVELEDAQKDNRIYGITVDEDGRSWVAYYGDSQVLSVRPSGRSATYYSPDRTGWSPVGVVKTDDALFVAEIHGRITHKLRVTKVDIDGERSIELKR